MTHDPIILIHGFPLDPAMWQAQADALRAAGLTVHTPALPGFGAAPPWPRHRASMEAFAEEIHELIQRTCAGRATVGGFSMGGYVALALARAHPESLAALMLINTRADADTPEARQRRLASIEDIEKTHSTAGLIAGMLTRSLRPAPSAGALEQAQIIMQRQSPEGVSAAQYAMSRRRDQTDLLPTLDMPVLIISGSDDAIAPPSVALAMHNHMPGSMLVQIADAGHLCPIEQPDSVTAAIQTFLATLPKHEAPAA